ncbi:MAG: hypothetical protein LKJ25_08715 [Clostridia bacterium]|jgi:hypothetical protein|nr:hypothetical protein [Clostridia bacterium]
MKLKVQQNEEARLMYGKVNEHCVNCKFSKTSRGQLFCLSFIREPAEKNKIDIWALACGKYENK